MEYKESVSASIQYVGKWNARHLVKELSYKEIFGLAFSKLMKKETSFYHEQLKMNNALLDEGEINILNAYFRADSVPVNFYIGLGNGTLPGEGSTLSSISANEVSGTGYARQIVNRNTTDWGVPSVGGVGFETTSTAVTFNATGTWSTADYMFLTDVSTGTSGNLLVSVGLGTPRTLINGDSLSVDLTVNLI